MDAMRDIEKKNLTREFPWEPLWTDQGNEFYMLTELPDNVWENKLAYFRGWAGGGVGILL